jgi:hypothetical protein
MGELRDNSDWRCVVALCRNSGFWKWICAFNKFTVRCEQFRNWGNGCLCHQELLKLGRPVVCDKLSRRLAEAPDRVDAFLGDLTTWCNTLTVADCEHDEHTFLELVFVVRRFVPEGKLKYKFVGQVPYIASNITKPRWALEFVNQYRASPRADHHRLTNGIADEFMDDIIKISTGDVSSIPEHLKQEQRIWEQMPLSSSRAEGYHRTTRLTKIRGAAARLPWILSSARLDQNLELLEELEDTTESGMQCFNSEYRSCSRILQTKRGDALSFPPGPW